jgi:predicted kinase
MQVIILRGIPGSGKSTLVQEKWPTARVVSADNYFMERGVYKFDPKKLPEAHKSCLQEFMSICHSTLLNEHFPTPDTLVVDNTGCSLIEVAPYVAIAQSYSFEVRIITLDCPADVAAKRNVHGVSGASIIRMKAALDKGTAEMPGWWKHELRS